MSHPERPDGAITPWSPSSVVARPAAASASWAEDVSELGPPRMFTPKMVLRALKRHWWQILALWLIGSIGLVYLAATKIRPSYDATAWLKVEPPPKSILVSGGSGFDFGPYLDTQVLLVTSPDILSKAISDPQISKLPKIAMSLDPEIDLRKEISVAVPQKGTHVIMVKMTGENPKEVASIVNAVVRAYLDKAQTWTDDASNKQIEGLRRLENELNNSVNTLRDRVRELTEKAGEAGGGNIAEPNKDGERETATLGKLQITRDQYRSLVMELNRQKSDRYKAEHTVKFLEDEIKAHGGIVGMGAGKGVPLNDEQLQEQIEQEFLAHPDTMSIDKSLDDAETKLNRAIARVKNKLDPTLVRLKEDLKNLEEERANLWKSKYPRLKRQIQAAAMGAGANDVAMIERERALTQAKLDLQRIVISEKFTADQLKTASIEVQSANKEILNLKFAQEELTRLEKSLETVSAHKQELDYEAKQGARIGLIAEAKASRSAASDNRLKAMLAAPVMMLFLSCLVFVALEFRSGRVADPDELSQRIRVGVIGVVPPLPSLNASNRTLSVRGLQNEKRRVEEFVQSLDHLRVTICAPRAGQTSDRRCVLITSATGGEGKTTLAAQLAGRCANAGLMTLLIDADLRRPSLGDLLEVPEGPGFVDVLTGEVTPEAAMVVIGNAGGFHLLPAGTLGQDPSRLLHGDRLGQLIAQFRETFDIVIIDAPPVLAVPDALLLGRWTEGAILAVRHDTSRFPLVERANKRLASVGVPVLGAVVNGCRTMESAYGSYRYTPYSAAEAPGTDAEV